MVGTPMEESNGAVDKLPLFISTMRSATGYDFSEYSDKSLRRRVARLLEEESLDLNTLLHRLTKDKDYGEHVVNRITVNTSELFRDPEIWQNLRGQILPRFRYQPRINVWHAGCSTGQEVYSLMMLLNELELLEQSRLYASDLNGEVLDVARKGVYRYRFNLNYLNNFDQVINSNPLNYEEQLNVPYSKYFHIDKQADLMRMHPFLTERPLFRRNDLTRCENPFYVRFDIIFCRNVLIYFNASLQARLLALFHRCLYPNGVLVLGVHESLTGPSVDKFQRLAKVYIKKD